MGVNDNLPPGVTPGMLPGNRPEDVELDEFFNWLVAYADKNDITLLELKMRITKHRYVSPEEFRSIMGYGPGGYDPECTAGAPDDMERANCTEVGEPGHLACGWCEKHNTLRMKCGCLADRKKGVGK